jgi:DNA-binding response OmpR family regulator
MGWVAQSGSQSFSTPQEIFAWIPGQAKAPVFSSSILPGKTSGTGASPETHCSIILLIEDNPADANLIHEALLEHAVRCEVLEIRDGESGVKYFDCLDRNEAPCPDLVILDLNLPRRPGAAVLQRIRASGGCAHVPVIVLTSSNDQKDRDETARLGASLYIQKPAGLDEILQLGALFREVLEKNRQ